MLMLRGFNQFEQGQLGIDEELDGALPIGDRRPSLGQGGKAGAAQALRLGRGLNARDVATP
jgi:hypothetical protein